MTNVKNTSIELKMEEIMDKIVIIGIGDVAITVKNFIERHHLFEVIAFSVNKEYVKESTYEGLPIIPFEELDKHIDKDKVYTFVAASHFNYMHRVKRKLYTMLKDNGYMVANLISPLATIVPGVKMGCGNWIHDYAYIDEDVNIGSNNVIRQYAYIAHWCCIGNHNFIGIKSMIAGKCVIGDQNFFGVSSTLFNRIHIGNKCIIGAGTVIKKNVKDYCMCRVANNVEVFEYDEDTIENKLGPMPENYRKYYDTIKK